MQGAGLVLTAYQASLAKAMDITANNIANLNTSGFKRETIAFDSYLVRPEPKQTFLFAVESGTYRDAAQGPTLTTGNPLDVAIQGEGYIPVQTEAGIRYTRAGAFQLNNEGDLVTASGDKVLGDGNQQITLPPDAREILIGTDGTVSAKSGNSAEATLIGKLSLVKFQNELELMPVGNGYFNTTQEAEPSTSGRLVQGAIEQSNVQSVSEMTRMIDISRNYQKIVHMLEAEHERQKSAIQRLGKITA